ncbi:hypothetical protein GGE65_008381 [Skermanella aerolata]|uniref:hypothetical protein n=1 Tax=Skermanella aerolata TaxID=393310 RepID=UPI003D1A61D7
MAEEDWCSVSEAARRLGVTPTAIRNRIKRGTLEHRPNGNSGKLVRVPLTVPVTVAPTVTLTVPEPLGRTVPLTVPDTYAGEIAALRDLAAERLARVERAESRADRLDTEVDRLRLELDKEREERQRLVRVIEEQAAAVRSQGEHIKLLTDQRERRPWWQRWWS